MNAMEHVESIQNLVYHSVCGERFGGNTLAMYGVYNSSTDSSLFSSKFSGNRPHGPNSNNDQDFDGIPNPLDHFNGPGANPPWDLNNNGTSDIWE